MREIPTFLLRFFTTSLKTEFCSLNKTSCGSSFLSFTVQARCLRFFMLASNKLADSVKFLKAVAGNGYIWLRGDGIYLKVEDNTYLPLQVDRQSRHPRRNVLKFQVGSPTRNFDSRVPFSRLRIFLPALLIDSPIRTNQKSRESRIFITRCNSIFIRVRVFSFFFFFPPSLRFIVE